MAKLARVFITQPVVEGALQRLRAMAEVAVYPDASRIIPRQELLSAVANCDILCCLLHDRIDAEVIDAGKSLRMIADCAITPSNIDIDRAHQRGIVVSGFPKDLAAEVTADHQWALLMAIARRIPEADRTVRSGVFPGAQSLYLAGTHVSGKTLGTIGLGAIGTCLVRRARAFRMRILYTKRSPLSHTDELALGVEYRPLTELLRESDFVVVNASYRRATHHLVGTAELAALRPSAFLINAARGPIVDEAALATALRERRIAGAALDVFEAEPQVHPELLRLDNVILTPHLGTATLETLEQIESVMADNVIAFLTGQPLPVPLEPDTE